MWAHWVTNREQSVYAGWYRCVYMGDGVILFDHVHGCCGELTISLWIRNELRMRVKFCYARCTCDTRTLLEDNERPSRLSTSTNLKSVDEIMRVVRDDRRRTIRRIVKHLKVSYGIVQGILVSLLSITIMHALTQSSQCLKFVTSTKWSATYLLDFYVSLFLPEIILKLKGRRFHTVHEIRT